MGITMYGTHLILPSKLFFLYSICLEVIFASYDLQMEKTLQALVLLIVLRLTGSSLPPLLGQWLQFHDNYLDDLHEILTAPSSLCDVSVSYDPGLHAVQESLLRLHDFHTLCRCLPLLQDQWRRYLRGRRTSDLVVERKLKCLVAREGNSCSADATHAIAVQQW